MPSDIICSNQLHTCFLIRPPITVATSCVYEQQNIYKKLKFETKKEQKKEDKNLIQ
jgi:hypothetical protein